MLSYWQFDFTSFAVRDEFLVIPYAHFATGVLQPNTAKFCASGTPQLFIYQSNYLNICNPNMLAIPSTIWADAPTTSWYAFLKSLCDD